MLKFIPSITVAAGLFALSGLASTSAQAASLNLSTWTPVGDVTRSINSATITNANSDQLDDATEAAPTTPVIINVSNINPIAPGSLETSLGLAEDSLGPRAQEGSGLHTNLTVGAGDIFSFNWSTFSLDSRDRFFAVINGTISDLSSPALFSHTFETAGTFRVGFGVVDQDEVLKSSVLAITNAELTPAAAIPSPALLPGMIGFGLSLIRKRRSVG